MSERNSRSSVDKAREFRELEELVLLLVRDQRPKKRETADGGGVGALGRSTCEFEAVGKGDAVAETTGVEEVEGTGEGPLLSNVIVGKALTSALVRPEPFDSPEDCTLAIATGETETSGLVSADDADVALLPQNESKRPPVLLPLRPSPIEGDVCSFSNNLHPTGESS